MALPIGLRSPKFKRAIAAASVILATGGLVLYKASPASSYTGPVPIQLLSGKNSASFSGPGAHGMVSLSQTGFLAGSPSTVYADVRLVADPLTETKGIHAPIAMAVVLDTSGSMDGEKIEDAKRSILRLLSEMRDDDEIAFVRYSDTSELVQPLERVGAIRASLSQKIRETTAGGGTNIPSGLSQGIRALDDAQKGRVKRIVLASDGLDATRNQAEMLARNSFASGITVSSLGIGLDFDEAYMGGVAQSGHGNFAFVKDGASLASFLHRELEETSQTTIENARVKLEIPRGMHFVNATGADAQVHGSTVELALGALFAGDQRRALVEFTTDGGDDALAIETHASWNRVGGSTATIDVPKLTLLAFHDSQAVEQGKDGAVLASAVSITASRRQLEAASAWSRGDVATANALMQKNEEALRAAATAAPPAAAAPIQAQLDEYRDMKKAFGANAPTSVAGRSAAKAAAAKDMSNLQRSAF